jgi:hypothetical protein
MYEIRLRVPQKRDSLEEGRKIFPRLNRLDERGQNIKRHAERRTFVGQIAGLSHGYGEFKAPAISPEQVDQMYLPAPSLGSSD